MHAVQSLLLACILIVAAGCSAPTGAAPIQQDSQSAPAQPGPDPVQTAKTLAEGQGQLHWLEPPTAYVVQQMTYGEAHKHIPMLSEDGDQFWGSQTSVWLVALRGRWELTPIDPAQAHPQAVPYEGCSFVLFRAADGALIAMGDTTCPGKG